MTLHNCFPSLTQRWVTSQRPGATCPRVSEAHVLFDDSFSNQIKHISARLFKLLVRKFLSATWKGLFLIKSRPDFYFTEPVKAEDGDGFVWSHVLLMKCLSRYVKMISNHHSSQFLMKNLRRWLFALVSVWSSAPCLRWGLGDARWRLSTVRPNTGAAFHSFRSWILWLRRNSEAEN